MQDLLPDLEDVYAANPEKPTLRYYSGKEDAVEVYMDHIDMDELS